MGSTGHEAETELRGEDIGSGVHIRFFQNKGNRRAGIIVSHRHDDGAVCSGAVPFDVPENQWDKERGRPLWAVESLDPLTISPSVHDPSCGLHGFIRDGKWVPA